MKLVITTWRGIAPEARHWYGKFVRANGRVTNLRNELGDRFLSREGVVAAARAFMNRKPKTLKSKRVRKEYRECVIS